MSKTITIEDDVYKLLASLKEDSRDSFTRVIRRYIHKPCDTAGELLDAYEHAPPPDVDLQVLKRIEKELGQAETIADTTFLIHLDGVSGIRRLTY